MLFVASGTKAAPMSFRYFFTTSFILACRTVSSLFLTVPKLIALEMPAQECDWQATRCPSERLQLSSAGQQGL